MGVFFALVCVVSALVELGPVCASSLLLRAAFFVLGERFLEGLHPCCCWMQQLKNPRQGRARAVSSRASQRPRQTASVVLRAAPNLMHHACDAR